MTIQNRSYMALIFMAVTCAFADDNPLEKRLTPDEIAQIPNITAGTGTAGLSAVKTTVLFGDPNKAGLYTIRLKVSPNTSIRAHTHRDTRTVTVLNGLWHFGYGDINDPNKAKDLPPGSFYTEPATHSHWAFTGAEGAVVEITGFGPSDTVYAEEKPNH